MYDNYDDDCDSLMAEVDDLLYNEEDERMVYEREVEEINEYWDRENEYIKSSGIYTQEEVKQILDEHNRIRNEKIAEAEKRLKDELEWIREQKEWAAEEREWERELDREDRELERELERQLAAQEENNANYRAYREELEAYADFIASLDMAKDD